MVNKNQSDLLDRWLPLMCAARATIKITPTYWVLGFSSSTGLEREEKIKVYHIKLNIYGILSYCKIKSVKTQRFMYY